MARFLVIDDDATIREMIGLTLEGAGHDVTAAACGQEGLALFRAYPSDVVITDLLMPGASIASVAELRHEFPKVPIIVVSGMAPQDAENGGVTRVLSPRFTLPKPFRLTEFLTIIDQILQEENLPIPPRQDSLNPFSRTC